MSTDAQILTAARDYHAACQAVKEADQAKAKADGEMSRLVHLCNEARRRETEAKTRLVQLSAAKPAEPAPKPEVPQVAVPAGPLSPVVVAPQPAPAPIVPLKAPVPTLNSKRR